MGRYVLKFGGTSLATIECIQRVANIICEFYDKAHEVIVVVSAMGNDTDKLLDLAGDLTHDPNPREIAVLLSSGEQVSIALLSIELSKRGYSARSFTGTQACILTDQNYKKARILSIDNERLKKSLKRGQISVVAGFQGVDIDGNITTLGRGGSDTSAVAIAASIGVDECRIYTDVDGVYTTDPKVVPEARLLDRVTFEEMLELSSLGAKVLQIRAVEFAGKYNVPLRVLSTFEEGDGTLITYEDRDMENPVISGVAFNQSEAKVSIIGVPDKPGVASQILQAVSDSGIEIDMIIQNVSENNKTDFTFTVQREDYNKTMDLLNNIIGDLSAMSIIGDPKIAKLSLVGVGMRTHAGIASTMFSTLAKEGINIQSISTSEIKISVIIDEKYLELGARALHSAFKLEVPVKEEFDPISNRLA